MRIITIILFFILSLGATESQAQSIASLKESIRKAQENIDKGNKLLVENKDKTSSTVEKIIIANRNITLREGIVGSIKKQIKIINSSIRQNKNTTNNLSKKLKDEKKLYSTMLKNAYKRHLSAENLIFMLSSTSLQDFSLRMYYLQRYSKMKTDLAESIRTNSKKITSEIKSLEEKEIELQEANRNATQEIRKLEDEKKAYNVMHVTLVKENKKLEKQVRDGIKRKKYLEKQISRIIAEENKARLSKKLTQEEIKLSRSFSSNRGKLPHPVASGVIVEQFGTHRHPLYPSIVVDNKGVDFAIQNGSNIKSVFTGVVTKIFFLQGLNNSIMIRHGDYITVYSGLTIVNVKTGDMVKTGQILGKIIDAAQSPTLHFEIHKGKTALNPESWLR